jgi:hypothetical protein
MEKMLHQCRVPAYGKILDRKERVIVKSIKFILVIGVLALLPLLAGGGKAQTSDPEGVTSPSGPVQAAISYQGVLTAPDGTPLSGTYDLEFTFWSASLGGAQVGGTVTRNGQIITDGLYSTSLDVYADAVYGQELWLRIRVRETGGTWETLSPRVQVLPTMYAMTVRPKARIEGGVSVPNAIVMATNTSSGWGLRGESRDPTGFGVYGYNGSTSAAAYGGGVIGITRTDGYGVRGEAPSSGDFSYGGYFTGRIGVRGYGMGSTSEYGYGGYFLSANYRGLYASSTPGASYYAGYFKGRNSSSAGVWIDGTLIATGSKAGYIVDVCLSDSPEPLEVGDVVAVVGAAEPIIGEIPVMRVRKATDRASGAVVGVVDQRFLTKSTREDSLPHPATVVARLAEGTAIRQGEYVSVVTLGAFKAIKVDASYGAIQPGDLLTASPIPGYAMRADDPKPGTIIGKALESLDAGQGTIYVLVTLQ